MPTLTALPTSVTSTAQGRGTLDLMRFVAAGLIVLYHYIEQAPVNQSTLNPVFARGYLATDFFLILSGYVLARAYGARVLSGETGWLTFFTRRVARIWPAHLVVLGCFVAVVGLSMAAGLHPKHLHDFAWPNLLVEAALIQAWGFAPVHGWNEVTWSLSALVVCYAAFPLLARLLSRVKAIWAAVLIVPGLGLTDLACRASLGGSLFDLAEQWGAVRALPLFVVGMMLAKVCADRPPAPKAAPWLLAGALAILAGAQVFGRFDLLSIACILVSIWAAGGVGIGRLQNAATYGARMSYALFLTHLLTATVWFGGLHALAHRGLIGGLWLWEGWILAFPLAFAAAALFERTVDGPIQAWLKRSRNRHWTAAIAAAPAS